MNKYAETFLHKIVVTEKILSEELLMNWYEKSVKLDKKSPLYDKNFEKKFRSLIEKFIDFLKDSDSDSSSSSSDSEHDQHVEEAKVTDDDAK